ncbi:MAG: threonine aldolase family protein [Propionibacteriales bacterium]|nr:threonine aldolase family protein [Propionibacteriales bacterium]
MINSDLIDLRSDTLTVPTEAMRRAMIDAPVGADVYGEDPTVHELEERTAELLGHEAGLYCATGSIANLLGIRLLTEPGQEVICDAQAHIVRAELGAHAALNGVTTRTWDTGDGRVTLDKVAGLMAPSDSPYFVGTAAVEIENTHNFASGVVQSHRELEAIARLCRGQQVGFHLDGARLWNAHVANGVDLADTATLFDTVSVCFSKGLGAPIGSVLVSNDDNIERARVLRKRMGAGWRQAGMMAAGALYALDHHLDRLLDDHRGASGLASAIADRVDGAVDPRAVETNIVMINTGRHLAAEVVQQAAEQGVRITGVTAHAVRAVTHLQVSVDEAVRAGAVIGDLLAA